MCASPSFDMGDADLSTRQVKDAVQAAADYTHQGIATAIPIGAGHGPLNQLHPILSRVLPS